MKRLETSAAKENYKFLRSLVRAMNFSPSPPEQKDPLSAKGKFFGIENLTLICAVALLDNKTWSKIMPERYRDREGVMTRLLNMGARGDRKDILSNMFGILFRFNPDLTVSMVRILLRSGCIPLKESSGDALLSAAENNHALLRDPEIFDMFIQAGCRSENETAKKVLEPTAFVRWEKARLQWKHWRERNDINLVELDAEKMEDNGTSVLYAFRKNGMRQEREEPGERQ